MITHRKITKADLQPFIKLVCVATEQNQHVKCSHKMGGIYKIGHLTADHSLYMESEMYDGLTTFNVNYILNVEGSGYTRTFIPKDWITDEELFAIRLGEPYECD